MDTTGLLAAVLLLIFVVSAAADASNAHRILIGEPPNNNTALPGKDSPVASPPPPLPAPSPVGNGSDPKLAVDKPSKSKTKAAPPAKTPIVDPGTKGLNKDTNSGKGEDPKTEKKKNNTATETPKNEPVSVSTPPGGGEEKSKEVPPDDGKDNSKGAEKTKKKKNDSVTDPPNADVESCDGEIKTCKVKDVVVACIKSFNSGSKEVTVLVQNIGDSILKAKLSAENIMDLEISKHQNKKVSISLDVDKSTNITLKSGDNVCELHMDSQVSDGNFFLRLPSYKYLVTPINGAYFLIITVLIFGGAWACCLVRKRKQRTGGGVPYQELEMGLPESVSATAVETAEGWDEGWDDDWDGDNAMKSPGPNLVGSISANGLTSRSGNKDGWENDWDD